MAGDIRSEAMQEGMVGRAKETLLLADFITNLKFEDIPSDVVNHQKLLILDTLGCGLFGSTIRCSKIVAELVKNWGGREEATVWGTDLKVPCTNAVFANGVAVESYELDDSGANHTGCAAIPSALAASEHKGGVNGKDFIAAVVAGFEVKARIYLAGVPHDMKLRRGYHDIGNSFSAAASAGRVLGLDAERLAYSLCMAASQTAGLYHTTMIKRIHPGWLAHGGLISALMAEAGLLGVTDILERRWGGFYSAYYETYNTDILVGDLGKRFLSMVHGFKYFSACASKITTLHAVMELREQYQILHQHPEMIDRISLYVSDVYRKWCGVDTDGVSLLKIDEINKAMMSGPYMVAVMLLMDKPEWLGVLGKELPYTEEWIKDPRVQELIGKTDMIVDRLYTDPIKIEIRLRDGGTFSIQAPLYRKGHPQNPMTQQEIYRKFRNLATYRVSGSKAEEIITMVERLEELKDVRTLAQMLESSE